ncbi:glycosyltransferase family 1 protein, partial [Aquisalimonas sp.]|uniref:glycosyltransferase family 1 protein n=1 Tax=Aquisalimonas sp. TaxID=1872621 RepID=UPI0025C545F1
MLRVLALTRYGRLGASSRLRTYQYQAPLRAHGIDVRIEPLFRDPYVEALYKRRNRSLHVVASFGRRIAAAWTCRDVDALWVEKEMLPWIPAFVELALLPRQRPLVVDYDDAIFHSYDRHRSGAVRHLLADKIDAVMRRADLVTAGNDYLAERARSAGAPHVELVPTVVDLDHYRPVPAPRDGQTTVGWIGSPSTAFYLDALKPVMASLSAQHGIRAVAIGARPEQVAGTAFTAEAWAEDTEAECLARL